MSRLKAEIEADCRKNMSSLRGDRVETFTSRRAAMQLSVESDRETKIESLLKRVGIEANVGVSGGKIAVGVDSEKDVERVKALFKQMPRYYKVGDVKKIDDEFWLISISVVSEKMSSDETTESSSEMYKEITEGQAIENISKK